MGLGGDHDDAGDQILILTVLKPLGRTIVPQQWGIVALVGIEAWTLCGRVLKLPPWVVLLNIGPTMVPCHHHRW